MQRIINECHEQAKRAAARAPARLDALVAALLERETLDQEEILKVTGLPPAPALQHRAITAAPEAGVAV